MSGPAISFEGVEFAYATGAKVLDGISFEVRQGSVFGLLGPNGVGKTTTIRLLLGLLSPACGTVKVLGQNPAASGREIRARSAALLEHAGLYEQLSAEENLDFFARAYGREPSRTGERAQKLLTRFGLWERRQEAVGTWSKGMKQKLAITRVLMVEPELIILDEPTSGLDVSSASQIRELVVEAVRGGTTAFLTTHNMAEAEALCEQVAVVCDGRVAAIGSPSELGRGVAGLEQALLRIEQEHHHG